MNYDWRKIAAQRFIGIAVNGTGRWCVLSCDKRACWLTTSEESARGAALGGCAQVVPCQGNHQICDLHPCPLPRKERADDHEDRAWLKKNA